MRYVDPRSACLICKPRLEVAEGPGVPVYQPGVIHRAECPTLPHLTAEQRAEFQAFCEELRRCQRRAWETASHYVIGGAI